MASNMWKVVHRIWRLKPFVCPPAKEGFFLNQAMNRLKFCRTPTTVLLASAPMAYKQGDDKRKFDKREYEVADDEDEDDDEDDDDEEDEENYEKPKNGVRGDMIRMLPSRAEVDNWTNNAESHPGYQATVRAAREILSTPPPPPPRFPVMPVGFCADPEKVPPVPPGLPALNFFDIKDQNDNHSKLPDNCPQSSPTLVKSNDAECTAPIVITPKMPDLPFCDRPVEPPLMPIPPPCGTMGPPPPPPPDPPGMLVPPEEAPPPLPLPPSLYYDLTDPPTPFEPDINSTPPLPCFPIDHPDASMAKCDQSGNNSYNMVDVPAIPAPWERGELPDKTALRPKGNGKNPIIMPPPPPMLTSARSQGGAPSQMGMLKKSMMEKRKKRRSKVNGTHSQEQLPSTVVTEEEVNVSQETPDMNQNSSEDVADEEPLNDESEFTVVWSSRNRN